MKVLFATMLLVLSGLLCIGSVLGQGEPVGARMMIIVTGSDIPANDILYAYADKMDLHAIEGLARAHPDEEIPFQDLIAKLPDALAGWTAADPTGMNMEMMGMKYSFGSRDYDKDGADDSVTVVIYDTTNQTLGPWAGFWYGKFQYQSSEGYGKWTTYKGYPAWEQRTYDGNEGTLVIGLAPTSPIPEEGLPLLIGAGIIPLILLRRRSEASSSVRN